jgi:hypothetical protein
MEPALPIHFIVAVLPGHIKDAPPVSERPKETMTNWKIVRAEFPDDTSSHHLLGVTEGYSPGRVSSAIQKFNKTTMTLTTKSGREYTLVGPPGFSGDAEYVWTSWCARNKVVSHTDVTVEFVTGKNEG